MFSGILRNYPPYSEEFESEEEYEEAVEAYWDKVDRAYDEWKDDSLTGDA